MRTSLPLLFALGLVLPAHAAERVALVIGNAAYAHGTPLENPLNDARGVAAALKEAGFETILAENTGLAAMEEKVLAFRRAADGAKAAWFYYSGHGVEVKGSNYLVPVDADVQDEFQVKHKTLALDMVLSAMDEAGTPLKVVVLDCCRDNPFGKGWSRSGARGLGQVGTTPEGTIIAFAASPGKTAADGEGKNSPYTTALVAALRQPGLEIDQVFKETGRMVIASTGKTQQPWVNSSFYDHFVLRPGQPGASAPTPLMPEVPFPAKGDSLASATRERPFVNSLGMEFIPLPGNAGVFMCRTETRVRDFRAYARATDYVQTGGAYVLKVKGNAKPGYSTAWELDTSASWEKPGFTQTEDHPVCCVSLNEAETFCAWLSKKEGKMYRLPSDAEWSAAVGVGKYPWGSSWPPPKGVGNYAGSEFKDSLPKANWQTAYDHSDGFARTAPAASFDENKYGFYDLGGNVWEWCSDRYKTSMNSQALLDEIPALKMETADDGTPFRVLRGGSWNNPFRVPPAFRVS